MAKTNGACAVTFDRRAGYFVLSEPANQVNTASPAHRRGSCALRQDAAYPRLPDYRAERARKRDRQRLGRLGFERQESLAAHWRGRFVLCAAYDPGKERVSIAIEQLDADPHQGMHREIRPVDRDSAMKKLVHLEAVETRDEQELRRRRRLVIGRRSAQNGRLQSRI